MATKKAPGILLHGSTKPSLLASHACALEDAGFGSLWVSEDYFMLAGFSSAAIVLQATKNVPVTLAAVASVARHPAVTAMEAATIAGAFPGRFTLAVGHGVPAWTRQMGLYPRSALTAMRETVIGVKSLLAGEMRNVTGEYFTFKDIELLYPQPELPVLIAAVGPKSVDLTAEIADGLAASALSGPAYVRMARDRLVAGRTAAGRSGAAHLPVISFLSIDEDASAARARIRHYLAFYLVAMGPTDMTAAYDVSTALSEMISRGSVDMVAQEMPDEWIDYFGIAGTPSDCQDRIDALQDAGATDIALVFTTGGNDLQKEIGLAQKLSVTVG